MAFFSSSFSTAISQPKMRQEGFHLPSPSPSNGNPPSPTANSPFDIFMNGHSGHTHQHSSPSNANANANANANNGSHFASLALPDAFSRSGGGMDFGDELAASLMASTSSPHTATSNERSTHTPPFDHRGPPSHAAHNSHNPHSAQTGGPHTSHGERAPYNIFDISAPPSAASAYGLGSHAFSLPHTSHRPEIPISQPQSLANPSAFDHHHPPHHSAYHHQGITRDVLPAHFNSTIPPLSTHHDPPAPSDPLSPTLSHHSTAYGPYTPNSNGSAPPRDTPSPASAVPPPMASTTGRPNEVAHGHGHGGHGRSGSRSRSRARPGTSSSNAGAGGPTRTAKSASKRRDSFSVAHSMPSMLHHLPSPPSSNPSRPQAIVIPSHAAAQGGPHSASLNGHGQGHGHNRTGPGSPLGPGLGTPISGVGSSSGWFLPGANGPGPVGATPGSAPGGEYSLPTPDSLGHGGAFGSFGGIGMGVSPQDTSGMSLVGGGVGGKGESPPLDAAAKQAAIVNEKRRRRRESHNAVERRRRDNINEKISELATLIPEVMLDPTAPSACNGAVTDDLFSQASGEGSKKEGSAAPSNASSGAGGNNNASNANGNSSLNNHNSSSQNGNNANVGSGAEDSSTPAPDSKDGGAPIKANKGMILRKSVEYIRYLQQLVNAQAARNRELEAQLTRAGIAPSAGGGSGSGGSTGLGGLSGLGGLNGSGKTDDQPAMSSLTQDNNSDFGDGVLNLHSFSSADTTDYMGMGIGGFGQLEPMAERSEMEMEMEMEDEFGDYGRNGSSDNTGHGSIGGHTYTHNGLNHSHSHTHSHTRIRSDPTDRDGTSPSAGSEEDGLSTRDPDVDDDIGGVDGMEERGRRDRDGRVPGGVVVKEETHMDL